MMRLCIPTLTLTATLGLGAPNVIETDTCAPVPISKLRSFVDRSASRNGITPDLIWAVILRESASRPCAVSSSGAMGIMQLKPETAIEVGIYDLLNPERNIEAGARYLGRLLRRYRGDLTMALAAYHAGPGTVDRSGGLPASSVTRTYVADIIRLLNLRPHHPTR